MSTSNTYERIYAVVKRIPYGRVATYGQIAKLAYLAGHARQVGYALNALSEHAGVPWHRVINAKGEISRRADPICEVRQRQLLKKEGVLFDDRNRTSLERFGWKPRMTKDGEKGSSSPALSPAEGKARASGKANRTPVR